MMMLLTTSFKEVSETDFRRVSEMVYRHCGINLSDGKRQLVQARIAKRMRSAGFVSVSDYLDYVSADASGQEFTLLIDAMSTNLTSFYREPDHFRFLADTALPRHLLEKGARQESQLRLWSAGCSTGEEPYTLAMTLLDNIPNAKEWDIKILATDISTHALSVAKSGFYSAQRLESLPAGYSTRFFRSCVVDRQKGYKVAPEVQSMIAFRHLNLMDPWPFSGPFDFIFCRNVMIYFDKPTQQRLVNRFWEVLVSGGILFTGHSESLTGVKHPFQYVRPTVYAK
jgi:chemotaxis protein methyltransferase CheR